MLAKRDNIKADFVCGVPDPEKYHRMIDEISSSPGMDTLIFQRLDDRVVAIGLPKEHLCIQPGRQLQPL